MFVNYATGLRTAAPAIARDLLDRCGDWCDERQLAEIVPAADPEELRKLLDVMVARGLLLRSDRPEPPAETAMAAWRPWNPSAGLFHTVTKNVRFITTEEAIEKLDARRRGRPMPDTVKSYPGAPSVALPPAARDGEFTRVLLERRTWRRFSRKPVPLADLATMLQLTGGVQRWVNAEGEGRVALKTSPSGGARHAIELYVLARNIKGLSKGIYHYQAEQHRLARIRDGATPAQIERYLPTQWWYRGAAAVVFFAPVFARSLWRYEYARAYRAVMIEAGHLCQTFCLSATSLGLAPFCTMALADQQVDGDLGLDGIAESAIYCAGVGVRPEGVDWAPGPTTRPAKVGKKSVGGTRKKSVAGRKRTRG